MALWGDARTRGNFYRLGRQVPVVGTLCEPPMTSCRPEPFMTEFCIPSPPRCQPLKPPPAPSRRAWPAALALGALLTACGGGGSDGAAPPPAPVPPSAPVPPPAPRRHPASPSACRPTRPSSGRAMRPPSPSTWSGPMALPRPCNWPLRSCRRRIGRGRGASRLGRQRGAEAAGRANGAAQPRPPPSPSRARPARCPPRRP